MQNHCKEALVALKEYDNLSVWMKDYHRLFWDLTNTPPMLPTLINASFQGEDFKEIRQFCEFYLQLKG
mgnify:CR=1 FL=1